MALPDKKLSDFLPVAKASVGTTTKFVVLNGSTLDNGTLLASEFVENGVESTDIYRALSANAGRLLDVGKVSKDSPVITVVPVYADNAAAAALATGTVYRTSTGVLMIKY